jgi:hypothetical protein
MAFDYTTGNPNNLTGGLGANMLDIQGPFLDLKSFLNQRIAAIPTLVTNLPAGPVDGQEVYYLADSANGVVWHLRYRSASGSAYKWEFVGGAELSNEVVGDDSISSAVTTYGDPVVAAGGNGPSVTLPLAGDYRLHFGMRCFSNVVSFITGFMSLSYAGSTPTDADAVNVSNTSVQFERIDVSVAREMRKNGLAAGTVAAKYRVTSTGSSFTIGRRFLYATPVRVG